MKQFSVFAIVGGIFLSVGGTLCMGGVWLLADMDRVLASPSVSVEGDPYVLAGAFVGMGGLLFVLGAILWGTWIRKQRRATRLVRQGRYVWADVVDIEYDWSVRINRKQALRLVFREDASGHGGRKFQAGPLPQSEELLRASRARAKVYIDPASDDYYVDMSTLEPDRRSFAY